MATIESQRCRTNRDRPSPSEPSTRQIGSSARDSNSKEVTVRGVIQPDNPDAVILELGQRGWQAGNECDRHVLDRASRCLRNGRRHMDGPMLGQQHSRDAGTVAVADDRAEIAGVRHPVHCDQEWLDAIARAQKLPQVCFLKFCCERHHTLRRLAARLTLDLGASDIAQGDALRSCDLDDVRNTGITFELSADEDVVDLALFGHQQFADRLATLDLLSAETATGGTRVGLAAATLRATSAPATIAR